jgi:hypothetical protein
MQKYVLVVNFAKYKWSKEQRRKKKGLQLRQSEPRIRF